ncbi:Reverse transcriptase (RNA-dependent DNA polymerase), partial [Popillia japonica]
PNQYAYRQGRSTEDAINAAVMVTRETTKKYAIALFVDISGAFDNLWWPALYERLRQMNCPQQIYKIVRSYCQDRYANMRCPGETISKKLTKGCPQGSICGPIFWDIIMSDLLRTLEQLGETEANVAYADDLLLIITADSRAAIEQKAMVITRTLADWCDGQKLKISPEKTTYAVLKGNLLRDPKIHFQGKPLRRTKDNMYLLKISPEKTTYAVLKGNLLRDPKIHFQGKPLRRTKDNGSQDPLSRETAAENQG